MAVWDGTHIFFLQGAFSAVVCIRDSWTTTYNTATFVRTIITFVTYAHECSRTHIGVTDRAPSITFTEQPCCRRSKLEVKEGHGTNRKWHHKLKQSRPYTCLVLTRSIVEVTSQTAGVCCGASGAHISHKASLLLHALNLVRFPRCSSFMVGA